MSLLLIRLCAIITLPASSSTLFSTISRSALQNGLFIVFFSGVMNTLKWLHRWLSVRNKTKITIARFGAVFGNIQPVSRSAIPWVATWGWLQNRINARLSLIKTLFSPDCIASVKSVSLDKAFFLLLNLLLTVTHSCVKVTSGWSYQWAQTNLT